MIMNIQNSAADLNYNVIFNDISKTCRICLDIIDELTSIEKVKDLWISCFNQDIPDNNGLPSNICQNCKETLENFYSFKTQYLNNEQHLRDKLFYLEEIKLDDLDTYDHDYCVKEEKFTDNSIHYESSNQLQESGQLTQSTQCNFVNVSEITTIQSTQSDFVNEPKIIENPIFLKTESDEDIIVQCDVCMKTFSKYGPCCSHILDTLTENSKNDVLLKKYKINRVKERSMSKITISRKKHRKKLPIESQNQASKFKCNICGQTYTTKFYLKYHILKHQGEKNFTCSVCGMSFLLKQYLREHFEMHEPGHYSCEQCGKTFPRRVTLKRHRARHRAVRKHICQVCFKAFFEKDHLKNHMVVHTNEREFICNICNKSFALKGTLTKHKLTHNKGSFNSFSFDNIKE